MGMIEFEVVEEDDPALRDAVRVEVERIMRNWNEARRRAFDRQRAIRRRHRSTLGESWIPSDRLAKKIALAEYRRLGDCDHDLGGEQ